MSYPGASHNFTPNLSSPLPSRPVYPHIPTTCSAPGSSCGVPVEFAVPLPLPPQRTMLEVRCWKCGGVFEHMFYPVSCAFATISFFFPESLYPEKYRLVDLFYFISTRDYVSLYWGGCCLQILVVVIIWWLVLASAVAGLRGP